MAKTTVVNTVLGPKATSELGAILTHEHLIASPMGVDYDSTAQFDREGELLKAIQNLKELKAHGVSTIIDPIPMELGRHVDFMQEASQASGVNIICATGLYTAHGSFTGYPTHFRMKTMEQIADIYTKEITEGVGPRKIKPGVIKCATGPRMISDDEKKALRAAARAHQATGTPITTHTTDGTMGPEQVAIFEEEGVDPRRVTIGHCSDSADLSYLVKIAQRGAFIGFDRVGLEGYVKDEVKVGVVAALVAMGFVNQIVLSHDNVGCMHGMRMSMASNPEVMKKRSYTYVLREFVPAMKKAGITDAHIKTMLVDNPRRFFEGS